MSNRYSLKVQERDDYCACSVLQAIFKSEGINFSQDDIAVRLTRSKNGFRLDDEKIRLFFRSRGLKYISFNHNETPFNEPDFLLENMQETHGIIGVNNHAYLFVDFNFPHVSVINPETGNLETKNDYSLFEEMSEKGGCFGLVKKLDS